MLTADLVRAYKRGQELKISAWKGDARERAVILATGYAAIAEDSVGQTRGELMEALDDIPVASRERKLADGLRKLALDRCDFEVDTPLDPPELRADVFSRAAEARRLLDPAAEFDRDALIAAVAAEREQPAEEIERLLFADLKDAHRLLKFEPIEGEALVALYEESQVQAVLLKAESIVATVHCQSAATYRALFRRLKFQRLLHRVEPIPSGAGYRIHIDGPASMFRSVTKYGLQLAMALPALRACDRWHLHADVRWGKARTRLKFEAEGTATASDEDLARLPDEVQALVDKQSGRVKKKKSVWKAKACSEILDVPGLGVCVPDLVFQKKGAKVYLEVLGFWSRDAVWKRVELVQAGIGVPIVFAVPARLRVSEQVLEGDLPGALYVYKGVMSPTQIEERLEAVCR